MKRFLAKALNIALRPVWRLTRGVTLGVRVIVLRDDNAVLLVRHTYQPGWQLPGGGVEHGESAEEAAKREVAEEGCVDAVGPLELMGLYWFGPTQRADHIACYVLREWQPNNRRRRALEIAEARFFPANALPDDLVTGARNRLAELFDGAEQSVRWK